MLTLEDVWVRLLPRMREIAAIENRRMQGFGQTGPAARSGGGKPDHGLAGRRRRVGLSLKVRGERIYNIADSLGEERDATRRDLVALQKIGVARHGREAGVSIWSRGPRWREWATEASEGQE